MKKIILFLLLSVAFVATAVCQAIAPAVTSESVQIDFSTMFATFSGIVAVVPFVMEFIKRIVTLKSGIVTQIISWCVGAIICYVGWYFKLGFLISLTWWQVAIVSLAVGLCSNGFYKTDAVTAILSKIKLIKAS